MWQFWIDWGVTFTDIVERKPNGSIIIDKLLSENSGIYKDAAIAGIKKILNLKKGIVKSNSGNGDVKELKKILKKLTVKYLQVEEKKLPKDKYSKVKKKFMDKVDTLDEIRERYWEQYKDDDVDTLSKNEYLKEEIQKEYLF